MRWTIFGPIMAATLVVAGPRVYAEDFPTKPVRIIVPYAAGGPSDTGARLVLDGLSRALGKPVYVENRGGGGGLNGTEEFLAGDLDGYTLLMPASRRSPLFPGSSKSPTCRIAISLRSARYGVRRRRWSCGRRSASKRWRNSSHTPKPIPAKSRSARRELAPCHISARCCCSAKPASSSFMCRFAAPAKACRCCSAARSTDCSATLQRLQPQVKAGKLMAIGVAAPERTPALPDTPTIG